jgi:hypothetical protein
MCLVIYEKQDSVAPNEGWKEEVPSVQGQWILLGIYQLLARA